jgi:hypothetical protein
MFGHMETLIGWGLTTLVAAFIGSFLGGYLKKKGENLATHEDIDKLVAEMKAVTQATKEIEARISNEVWERQKRWEVKREAIFEAMKNLATIDDEMMKLNTVFQAARQSGNPREIPWVKQKSEAANVWTQASATFERTKLMVLMVCGKEVQKEFGAVSLTIRAIVDGILRDNAEIYAQSLPKLLSEEANLSSAIRKELRIDEPT